MITNTQLKQIILGLIPYEKFNLEFKKSEELSRSMLETVSSFANTDGGTIALGINQNSKGIRYIGINDPAKLEDQVKEKLQNAFENLKQSDYQLSVESIEIHDLPYIKIDIHKVTDQDRQPVYIKDKGVYAGSYVRTGESDVKMSKSTIEKYLRYKAVKEHELPRTELQIVPSTSKSNLDLDSIKAYYNLLQQKGIQLEDYNPDTINNFLISKNIIENEKVTIFGLLCFGINNTKFLSYKSTIHLVNNTKISIKEGDRSKNDLIIEGNISKLMFDSVSWILKNVDVIRKVSKDTGLTTEESKIPVDLIRELVSNLLIHRDYSTDKKSIIKIDDSGISFLNSGVLDRSLYTNNILIPGKIEHINPSICKYCYYILGAEGQGKGFSAILTACLENKIDIPEITLDPNGSVDIKLRYGPLLDTFVKSKIKSKKYVLPISLNKQQEFIIAYLMKASEMRKKGLFVINISAEYLNPTFKSSLNGLITNKVITQEMHNSTVIYKLNEDLEDKDYITKLEELYNEQLNALTSDEKQVLQLVYEATLSKNNISARSITGILYPEIDQETDEFHNTYYGKLKTICQKLVRKGYILRDPQYSPNSPKGGFITNFSKKIDKDFNTHRKVGEQLTLL